MFRANNFDKLLDKATSNLRLDPDWPTIIQICDLIRQNDCSPKYAVAAVKKKLYSQNPHQAMFALLTLESIIKNCGSGVHEEVTSKAFCEILCDLVKTTQHENLRNKILELIQAWAFAFRNSPKYRSVQDTVNILKTEGYKFPALKESDAMFSADTAPEWADGEVCHRCRVAFSLIVRRHHCRACGQVFCQQCSSKTSILPKFGIEKEVRVCDACFDKVSRPPSSSAKLEITDSSSDYGPAKPPQKRPPGGGKTAEELQEEEELQLALALSQSEAEQKEKEKERRSRSHIAPDPSPHQLHPTISPTPSSVSASPEHSNNTNSELSRYLDRNYWEQRVPRDSNAAPTAPSSHTTIESANESEYAKPTTSQAQDDDAEDKEIDEFVETLKSQVEIFVNRMKSNSSRGRSIANDTAVQSLFMNITAMHSRLLRYIQQQDDKRVYLESLQDKVTQVRDSRAALDTLRAEYSARQAAAAEAADRQRQMQMAAKLQAMRKKKHEYLQYQRQLALQRVQEQEREMQMRQEQQKHQYMMSNSGYYLPGVPMQQFQQPYQNQPLYANPQYHPQMMPQTTDPNIQGQPQMSQANIPLTMGMTQSIPQVSNTYALSTSGMAISQAPINVQASMSRPTMAQQLPMNQQMLMQQMHQMRISAQPGMPAIGQNGLPTANLQNGTLTKQNQPNQVNQMMPQMAGGANMPAINPNNPMMGMQMNMRMPMMQNQQGNQVPTGYAMNMPNPQSQPSLQGQNIISQSQIPMQQNQMGMPGQMQIQAGVPPSQVPSSNQNQQVPQGQQMTSLPQQMSQSQQIPGQQMQAPSQQMQAPSQQMLMQGQMRPQGQNMPNQNIPSGQQGQPMHGQMTQQQQMQNQMYAQMQAGQLQQTQGANGTQMSQHVPQNVQNMQAPGLQNSQVQSQLPQNPQMQGQLPQNPQMQNQLPQNPQMQGQLQQNPQMQGQVPQNPQIQGQLPQNPQIQSQLPQNPQIQGQMPQNPQIQGQMPQNPQMQVPLPQNPQQIKIPPQNFSNPQQVSQPPMTNQQAQTSVKSENNNNTAELIRFD